jgi:putative ABC transport system permease protein
MAGMFFGIFPALQSTKTDLIAQLKEAGRTGSGGGSMTRTRDVLVISEVALAAMLLIGAGLLIKSFGEMRGVNPGFKPAGLITTRLSLPAKKYSQPQAVKLFHDRLVDRLTRLSDVQSVGVANVIPLSGMNVRTDFNIVGRPPASPKEVPAAQNRWVSPGWFETMQIPLRQGRDFRETDHEQSGGVVIIDESLARRYWTGEDPVGAHLLISFGGEPPRAFEIIGVAGNVKHSSLNEEETATLYVPIYQVPSTVVSFLAAGLSVVVRSADSERLTAALRREVQSVDSEVPASVVRTFDQLLYASIASLRFNVMLLSVFAAVAMLLAAVGLYGVISYLVAQRTRELGIRLALGAESGDMLKLVIGKGLKLVLIGIAFGLAGAVLATRLMKSLLYLVGTTDPTTYFAVPVLLGLVALLACYLPARRAARVDPIVALRHE